MSTGQAFAPSFLRMSSIASSKSAPTRSILLMKAMRGTLILVRLAPDRLRLRLHAGHRMNTAIAPSSTRSERSTSAVKSTWPGVSMMFTRILMPSKILNTPLLLVCSPEAGRRSRSDRDAALALLLHPVGHGGAFVHLTDLVDHAGVKKDALGQRRLAGIDVRGDADVPRPLERITCGSANSDSS